MIDISSQMNCLIEDHDTPPFLAFLMLKGEEDESVWKSNDATKSVSYAKNKSVLSTTTE